MIYGMSTWDLWDEINMFAPERLMVGRSSPLLLGFGNFSGASC